MTYAVIEVHRRSMIGAGGSGRKTRDKSTEAVCAVNERRRASGRAIVGIILKSIPVRKTRAAGHRCGNIRRAKKGRQCTKASGKTGLSIQSRLDGQFQSACTEVTNLDAGITSNLMLNAQTPGQNLGLDDRNDRGTGRGPAIQLSCARHIDLEQSATSQETLTVGILAPRPSTPDVTGKNRILFRLQLRS